MSVYESPRIRRLRSDLAALEKLKDESSIFGFRHSGRPPQVFVVSFAGQSLCRDRGKVVLRDYHEVEIKLGASYPRTMPEIRWLSAVYHPNISELGVVCLGAYGTHWVPSLTLDELCVMLWDMARYQNYDIRSPYNREAAQWAAHQTTYRFPVDSRPLRDGRAALGRVESTPPPPILPDGASEPEPTPGPAEAFQLLDLEVDPARALDPLRTTNALDPTPPEPEHEDVVFLD